MALSPYTKPTTPWSPNGISQYVLKANRKTVKASWKTWVSSYHVVTRTNDDPKGPIATLQIASAGTGYSASAGHALTYNYVQPPVLGSYVTTGSGTGAIVTISSVSSGSITGITITNNGSNYRVGDLLTVAAPGTTGILRVASISFTPSSYPAAFDYAGLYTNGAP